MAIPLNVNGAIFEYPVNFDEDWGVNATGWAQAVTNGMLQMQGGSFPLTADVNFGPNFGLLSQYFSTRSANPSTAGTVRLSSADAGIAWRNFANSGNLVLTTDASDQLLYNGNPIATGGGGAVLSITGTANQIIASSPSGAVTLSTPQDIAPASSPTFAGLTITAGPISTFLSANSIVSTNGSGQLTTLADPLTVLHGGTGNASLTAYAVLCGGTTGTNPIQVVSPIGLAGQALTSNGPGMLPSWQNVAGGGTVNSGDANRLAYYPASSNVVDSTDLIIYDNATGNVNMGGLLLQDSFGGNADVRFHNGTAALMVLQAASPGASRTVTIPDPGIDADFIMSQGTQTLNGLKSFSSKVAITGNTSNVILESIQSLANDITVAIQNTSNNPAAGIKLDLSVDASGGDPYIRFGSSGSNVWTFGVDNSNNEALMMRAGSSSNPSSGTIYMNWSYLTGQPFFNNGIAGTTTNDNANPGAIGEAAESFVSTPVSQVGGSGNLTVITNTGALSAGDWDVSAMVVSVLNGATVTKFQYCIGTASGNSATGVVEGDTSFFGPLPTSTSNNNGAISTRRYSLAGTTTLYLKFAYTFSAGTPQAFGRILARRVR